MERKEVLHHHDIGLAGSESMASDAPSPMVDAGSAMVDVPSSSMSEHRITLKANGRGGMVVPMARGG